MKWLFVSIWLSQSVTKATHLIQVVWRFGYSLLGFLAENDQTQEHLQVWIFYSIGQGRNYNVIHLFIEINYFQYSLTDVMIILNFANIFCDGNYRDERRWFFLSYDIHSFQLSKNGLDWKSPSWNEKKTRVLTLLHLGLKKIWISYGYVFLLIKYCWT